MNYSSDEIDLADWKADVRCSRDLYEQQKEGFAFLLAWFENWRITRALPIIPLGIRKEPNVIFRGRLALRERGWVLEKRRESWQLAQWGSARASRIHPYD